MRGLLRMTESGAPVFVVLRPNETPRYFKTHSTPRDPSEGVLTGLREVAAAYNLQVPRAGSIDGGLHLLSLVARVADDPLDEGEGPSGFAEQPFGAVSVLNTGRMNVDGQ